MLDALGTLAEEGGLECAAISALYFFLKNGKISLANLVRYDILPC
jgi:hypothetical protein